MVVGNVKELVKSVTIQEEEATLVQGYEDLGLHWNSMLEQHVGQTTEQCCARLDYEKSCPSAPGGTMLAHLYSLTRGRNKSVTWATFRLGMRNIPYTYNFVVAVN